LLQQFIDHHESILKQSKTDLENIEAIAGDKAE